MNTDDLSGHTIHGQPDPLLVGFATDERTEFVALKDQRPFFVGTSILRETFSSLRLT